MIVLCSVDPEKNDTKIQGFFPQKNYWTYLIVVIWFFVSIKESIMIAICVIWSPYPIGPLQFQVVYANMQFNCK